MHRQAKIDDFHRRIRAQATIGVNNIEFIDPFKNGEEKTVIPIDSPVVIFGVNGSGKTRLLNAISNKNNAAIEFHNMLISFNGDINVEYYNPSNIVVNVIAKINDSVGMFTKEEINDILDQEGAYYFTAPQVDFVNYILSSRFEQISVYEISSANQIDAQERDNIDDEDSVVPYFVISENGNARNMTHLSHGEIYCIHFIWNFTVKYRTGILLIDEPETFLYPVAQERLMDVLTCISCDEQEMPRQSILATHSRDIIKKCKSSNVIGLNKFDNERYYLTPSDTQEFSEKISGMGLISTKPIILFTEDAKARKFLQLIIEKCDNDKIKNISKIYFSSANGHSTLTKFPEMLTDFREFAVALIYDADAKEQITDRNARFSTLLPGKRNPEEDIINSMTPDNGAEFVKSLPKKYDKMLMLPLVRECLALNHHDFFVELARKAQEEEHIIFELSVDYWLSQDNNMALSEQFCKILEEIYNTYSEL